MAKAKCPFVAGAKVRIVKPSFFERCGYPISLAMECEEILGANREKIERFIYEFGGSVDNRTVDKVVAAIAYETLKKKKFGGRTRSIHNKERPGYAGQVDAIESVFFVKTGIYSSGSVSYDGEYDPPYLSDEKTHRILRLNSWFEDETYTALCIEAANVEIVEDTT